MFLGQLEAVAARTYGQEWERRGRERLAEMAMVLAALFPLAGGVMALVSTGGSGGSAGASGHGVTRLGGPGAAKAGLGALLCAGILGGTVALAATLRNHDSATRLAAPTSQVAPTTSSPTPTTSSARPRRTTRAAPAPVTSSPVPATTPTSASPTGDPPDNDDPASGGHLVLAAGTAHYGQRIRATASGFAPGERVAFSSDSPLVPPTTGTCDDRGTVTVTLDVGRAPVPQDDTATPVSSSPSPGDTSPSAGPTPTSTPSTSTPSTSPPSTIVTITAAGTESGLTASAELTIG